MGLADRMKSACKSVYAQVLSESDKFAIADWIHTGNYALNILISGHPRKGFPSGRILQLAGPSSTAKTYLNLEIVKAAQSLGYFIVYYDTEFAQDKESLEGRGIDITKMLYIPIATVEELSTSMLNIIEEVKQEEKVLIVVDSLGNLSTVKEVQDTLDASEKKDMTRAQKLKALFRVVTLKCGLKNVPIIAVNHVYATIGVSYASNTVGGGSGCLIAGTKVKTLDGLMNIEDIKEGMMVETLNDFQPVSHTFQFNKKTYKLYLSDGSVFECSENHKFLVKKNEDEFAWHSISEIQENDELIFK